MAFRCSLEPAPPPPALPGLAAVQRWFGGEQTAPGRLLVRDLTSRAGLASTAASDGSDAGSGSELLSSNSLQIVPGDAGLTEVEVPAIYLGGLPAPIPAGRPTIDADALLRQLSQGQLPSDSLPEGDREAWRAACRVTDPISAYNICQAGQLGGRRVVLTERGVAEQLARGTIQMAPVQDGAARGGSGGGRRGGLPNPFALLQRLASGLSEQRHLTKKVQEHAATLGGQRSGAQQGSGGCGASSGSSSSSEAAAAAAASEGGQEEGAPAADTNSSAVVPAGAGQGTQGAGPLQYSLQDLPARRLLAGGSPPQLAWVPLRVALSLLRALPQHFVLLQAAPQPPRERKQQQQHAHRGPPQTEQQQPPSSDGGSASRAGSDTDRGVFNARSGPGELDVWVIPGLHVRQITPEGNGVEFVPAFISHSSAQALWRDLREMSGGAMLMYRRLERAMMRRRLEAAAALIAGGGLRGPAASSSSAQDEEEGGMEEPPEISEFVRELGGALGQEAGPLGAAAAGGGGLQPPSGALSRLVATFACGVVSRAAQGLSWAGNTADWLLMATPLGPRLLGVPEATIQQHRLSELVGGMAAYNQQQAAMQCMLSCLSTLHDMAKEQQRQGPQAEQPEQGQGRQPQQDVQPKHGQDGQQQAEPKDEASLGEPPAAAHQPQEQQPASGGVQPAAATSAAQGSESEAPAAGDGAGIARPEVQRQRAALEAAEAEAVMQYRRRLAAAAVWVALSAKQLAEDPAVGGAPLGRLLAKTFLQQSSALTSAVGAAGLGGLPRVQHQAALPSGAPSLLSPPLQPPSSLAEAIEQVVAAGLPVLEHNGFQDDLFGSEAAASGAASASSGGGRGGNGGSAPTSASTAAADAAATAALAAVISRYTTADTHLGLGSFVKDSTTGAFRMLPSNPLAPPAVGRGLLLVGDLDLAQRQRGRTPGRTAARWLTVGVDDGRKLM